MSKSDENIFFKLQELNLGSKSSIYFIDNLITAKGCNRLSISFPKLKRLAKLYLDSKLFSLSKIIN